MNLLEYVLLLLGGLIGNGKSAIFSVVSSLLNENNGVINIQNGVLETVGTQQSDFKRNAKTIV